MGVDVLGVEFMGVEVMALPLGQIGLSKQCRP